MIDLFRPFMSDGARRSACDQLVPDVRTHRLYIGQGERVDELEDALKTFLSAAQDVLTVNSCTSALDLALHLCDVGGQQARRRSALSPKADVVISTPMTCTATNSPIVTRGGSIVWADVDPLTGLIDPDSVRACIERLWIEDKVEPNAIVAVDWAGQLADYPALRDLSTLMEDSSQRIPIIQDAAHSFGATVDGGIPFLDAMRTSESWHGDYTCFSFQAIKALTTGDGGALVCPDEATTERARLLRWYGLDRRSNEDFRCQQDIQEVGYKYHMNDIAAVIGLGNLPYVDGNLDTQRANANYYAGLMHGLTGVIIPPVFEGGSALDLDCPWWLFTLLVSDREHFQAYMSERGIATSPVHARNDHHGAFLDAGYGMQVQLPGVDFFAAHEVAVPVGWWLTTAERDHVAESVCLWAKEHGQELVPPQKTGV